MSPVRRKGSKPHAARPPRALLLLLPLLLAGTVALILLVPLFLLRLLDDTRLAPIDTMTLTHGLLFVIIILLSVIILLLLIKLLCSCGCGLGGGDSLLRLLVRGLAALLPGFVSRLRLIAHTFQHTADVAYNAVDPLHTIGTRLTEVGATLAAIEIPWVVAQTAPFWSALRQALRDSPAHIDIGDDPPDGFPNFLVMREFSIDPHWRPLGGTGGVGWWVTFTGEKTYAAGDQAHDLNTEFTQAAAAVNGFADTIEATQV